MPSFLFSFSSFPRISNNFSLFPPSGSLRVLRLHFPAFWFLSSALVIFVQFLSLPFHSLAVIQFPCISPASVASSASSGMMLAMLGVLSSIRHPPVCRRYKEMLQKAPNIDPQILRLSCGRAQRKTYAHGQLMVGDLRAAAQCRRSPML